MFRALALHRSESFVVSRMGESDGSLDTKLISTDFCTTTCNSEDSEKGDLNSVSKCLADKDK